MKSRWIEHKGKQVFYADYSGFRDNVDAFTYEVRSAIETLSQQPIKSTLVLANFTDTNASMMNIDAIRKLVPRSNHAVLRRALLGVSGVRRIFITTFSNVTGGVPVKAFETQEQALDWLVSEGSA